MSSPRPEHEVRDERKGRKVGLVAVVTLLVAAGLSAILLTVMGTDRSSGSVRAPTSNPGSGTHRPADTQTVPLAATFSPSAADLADAHAMLLNEENHGWDSCYDGLYINWDEVNGKTVGNWNGTGKPDKSPCTRHEDRMTTLRFLDGLLLYKADTGTTEFDPEIANITSHVLTLFTTANADPRGWAWDTVTQIAQLSGNAQFTAIANAMLRVYATNPTNNSRPDWQIEEASALVQSGVPSYVTQGTAELNQYWKAYYLSSFGLVKEPKGKIETADQGDIAIALAKAGSTTRANQVLGGIEAHLSDPRYGGFGEGAVIHRSTLSFKNKKTGGRMMNLMQLGKDLDNASLVSTMDGLFQQHIYQSSPSGYEGVLYEQQPDWALYKLHGTTENWVTSEAMGISYIALLSPN